MAISQSGAVVTTTMIALIQARMSSQRLPGKVLKTILNKPLLQYTIERIQQCKTIQKIIIATSSDITDLPLVKFCQDNHYSYFQGPLNNVVQRFSELLEHEPTLGFVRISGDSPLIDPALIEQGIELFTNNSVDLVTNVYPRTFPAGQSVEIIKSEFFRTVARTMTDPHELEHVTPHFYRSDQHFNLLNFESIQDLSHHRFVVDTAEDFEFIAQIIEKMNGSHLNYHLPELIKLSQKVKDL